MAKNLNIPEVLLYALPTEHMVTPQLIHERVRIRQYVQEALARFPESELRIPNVKRELVEGPAAESIVVRASKMEAPLIMMPTRGHTRFRQLLLGSVTAAVLHDASCPVWTEAHQDSQQPSEGIYRSLICAVDMGPRTPEVLRTALDFSKAFGAILHVVHSVPRGDQRFANALSDRAHALLVDTARENFAAHCQTVGTQLPLEIVEEFHLTDGVSGAVRRHNADLLVIGRGVIQGALGRLRTNAHNLIRLSPCAVLSV